MATNSRYQPVASEEAAEEPHYTYAPPSYQQEPLIGEARSEDDNVPDDFKFGGSVAEASKIYVTANETLKVDANVPF